MHLRVKDDAYHWEKTTIDSQDAFLAYDHGGSVYQSAVLWVWTFGVVDEFRSVEKT
jgi:hypothetical protein